MPVRSLFFSLGLWVHMLTLQAQFTDAFTDLNYTANPPWSGDTAKFDVSPGAELWLHAPAVTDKAYLSLPSQALPGAVWEFRVRMLFNPSSSNYARVYLAADQQDLLQPLSGYYVQVGSTADDICFYHQQGTVHTLLIDGPDGMLNTAAVNCMLHVSRDMAGNWTLEADTSGSANYQPLGMATDITSLFSFYAGVVCSYTATRSDKFYFDDFFVTGLPSSDTVPPYILQAAITGTDSLSVVFSEPLSAASTGILSHYTLDNGQGSPVSALINANDINRIDLRFSSPFTTSLLYHLTVNQITDWQGNIMTDTVLLLADYTPQAADVIINEVMADPEPQTGLPDAEYIELHNRTSFPLSIENWTLTCGATHKVLPAYTLFPDSFLVLLDEEKLSLFAGNLPLLGIGSFPSLTNSGMPVVLKDSNGVVMDSVFYTLSWYHDPAKDDGGFSLERINPADNCGGISNWHASMNFSGGTPGYINSVWNLVTPVLQWTAEVADSVHILLVSSRNLDTSSLSAGNFTCSCGADFISLQFIAADSVLLLTTLLPKDSLCLLDYNGAISDCAGNVSALSGIPFIRYNPAPLDIVIHELMVDESPPVLLPETEYIELHNRKHFPIRLRDWSVSIGNNFYTLPDVTIEPDSFLVLLHEDFILYFQGLPVAGMSSFPALPNTGAKVRLYAPGNLLVHSLEYDAGWYHAPGKEEGGWSLEMIDASLPCIGEEGWRASEDPAGGSPGMRNSVKALLADSVQPFIRRTGFISPDTVLLYFTEPVHPLSLDANDIAMSNGMQISDVYHNFSSWDKVAVITNTPLQPEVVYDLWLTGTAEDCAGNSLHPDTVQVTIPHILTTADLRINEVLSDPRDDGVDYVEVFHAGSYAVDLKELLLGNGDTLTQSVMNTYAVAPTSTLLFPGEYILLSENERMVKSQYITKAPLQFAEMDGFPSFPNDEGTVALANHSLQVMDIFAYSSEMHFPLLNSADGVSLERIYTGAATNDPGNWHSASFSCGYGTPGYQNSQYLPGNSSLSSSIDLDTEIFSPDNDGYQDVLTLHYQFDVPGYAATIQVYDGAGRPEKIIANNELLGTEGFFTWDGVKDDGSTARAGIHIVYLDLFLPDGTSEQIKKVCVVAVR